ncbi:MAG: hypothetical protein ACP5LA_02080 [Thermoplasmata archaeon]|nr:hypothetical protein [Thermoplasmata archaeon]
MRAVCVVGLGKNSINLARNISLNLKLNKLLISNEPGNENIFIEKEKISFLESEKVSTEYDEIFVNILNNYKNTELFIVISDMYDIYSISLTKIFGRFAKKFHLNSLAILLLPSASEINKYENAEKQIENFKENYNLIIRIGKDEIFKEFKDLPIKFIDKVEYEITLLLIKNLAEVYSIQEIINISSVSKELGFGLSITERMDKLVEAFHEAESSPWLNNGKNNYIISFNGIVEYGDINQIEKIIKFKNFNIKINKNLNQGRKIEILILNY